MNEWKKRSDYSIQKGEWIICRTVHNGTDKFTLWRGKERIMTYDTPEEAKRAAK